MDPVAQPVQPIGIEENRPQAAFLRSMLRNLQAFWSKELHRLNRVLPKDGTEAMTGPLELKTYTVSTLPTASDFGGSVIYVSDGGLAWSRAMVHRTSVMNISDSAFIPVIWNAETYDDGGWFDSGGDDFFTVPTGVTRARLTGNIQWDTGGGTVRSMFFRQAGSASKTFSLTSVFPTASLADAQNSISPAVDCEADDTFELVVFQESGGGLLEVGATDSTYFAIEAVEFAEGYGGTFQGSNGTRWVPLG